MLAELEPEIYGFPRSSFPPLTQYGKIAFEKIPTVFSEGYVQAFRLIACRRCLAHGTSACGDRLFDTGAAGALFDVLVADPMARG